MLKNRAFVFLAFLLILLLVAGCSTPTDSGAGSNSDELADLSVEAREFVVRMNEHRVSQGLAPLAWSPAVSEVALAHSQDMRDRGFVSHDNPDGDTPFDRMAAAGITYQSAGENIARGYTTGQAVFDGWIGSTSHRANIENPGFTHHGLGYVEDGHYWTHLFAQNPSKN